jgi:uncharacterized protein YjdB
MRLETGACKEISVSISRSYVILVFAIAISACGGGGGGGPPPIVVAPGPVTSISINVSALNLQLGDRAYLTATARDAANRPVPGATIVWSVDDSTVATVTNSGEVDAIGLGTTPIRATADDVEAWIRLTVEIDPRSVASVTIGPTMGIVGEGQSIQFTATALDASDHIITGRGENWTSGDSTIAFVEPLGRVTGLRTGLTSVNVKIDGVTASATIRVDANYAF